MKKLLSLLLAVLLLCSCGSNEKSSATGNVYKIGICNYVDDASLNQIIENIEEQLDSLETDELQFEVDLENCNANNVDLNQIIDNFINDNVDLMIGVATPVAIAMQTATEDNQIPVVFAAVSDPVSAGLVDSLENPGMNITGTSDYLDTEAIMNLILAFNPDLDKIALLYDKSQDSSSTSIVSAKKFLEEKGIAYADYNQMSNSVEVQLVVSNIIADDYKVVFTPSDNTIMAAELGIYEMLADAGVQHYAGADSFALNGAFVGYGVDYANLGKETANMVYDILVNKKDISSYPVQTFDNGIATINTEVCGRLGYDIEEVKNIMEPLCSQVKEIETADSFN